MTAGAVVAAVVVIGFVLLKVEDRVEQRQALPFYKRDNVTLELAPLPPMKMTIWSLVNDAVTVKLADPHDQITVVHFWATWCVPCQKELPGLMELVKDQDMKNIRFLVLSKEKPDDIKKYIEQQQMDPTHFYTYDAQYSDVSIAGVPMTYIIDRQGRVLVTMKGRIDWSEPTIKTYLFNLDPT